MLSPEQIQKLHDTATALVAPGKGILAADESFPTIEKRFKSINLESTEENRRAYRELLFTTPAVSEFISGVILFDETIRQKAEAGIPFPQVLASQGIIPGIKVDEGTETLSDSSKEKITKGIGGLKPRLPEYIKLGAKFAKWRAVITIGEGIPTRDCIQKNAELLAEYAVLCQEAGLVPIVEPEVLMDGVHLLERCKEVTIQTLTAVFGALKKKGIAWEGMLLKPNMVISGKECPTQASAKEIAQATLDVLHQSVPEQVPGIVFLSGGQTPEAATQNLDEINKLGVAAPWRLSFSYGRALQDPVLKAWRGEKANVQAAQKAYHKRAMLNSKATLGQYSQELENL